MALALYYVAAIAILIMHYTGFLQRNNMEWLVFVIAVSVFLCFISSAQGRVCREMTRASCRGDA